MHKTIELSTTRRPGAAVSRLLDRAGAWWRGLRADRRVTRAPIEAWPDYLLRDVGLHRPAELRRPVWPGQL